MSHYCVMVVLTTKLTHRTQVGSDVDDVQDVRRLRNQASRYFDGLQIPERLVRVLPHYALHTALHLVHLGDLRARDDRRQHVLLRKTVAHLRLHTLDKLARNLMMVLTSQ